MPPQHCLRDGHANEYRSYGSSSVAFSIADLANVLQVFAGLIPPSDPSYAFYAACANYDGSGAVDIADVANMFQYFAGLLSVRVDSRSP